MKQTKHIGICAWLFMMLLIVVMTGTTACTKKAAEEETETSMEEASTEVIIIQDETTEAETEEVPDERVVVDGKIRSYLTGEMLPETYADRRPVAVMISNDQQAQPHYGINNAGIIYEAPVEGVMNRFMAVFEDYDDLERIGSVRSCRTYYTYFAREWDAIYAHFGQATFALPYLENVDNINGLSGIGDTAFYRSSDKKAPHNAYTSGERLNKAIETLGYSQEYSDDYEGHFIFAKPDESVELTDAKEAYKIVPGYPYNKPWFEYHEDDGLYYRFQYEGKHMGNEGQLTVSNIIFQYVPVKHYATTDYLDIDVHTDGYGYFFTGGKYIPVTSKKDGEFGVTHYYDENGDEIKLNCGKTWICIINTSSEDDMETYGSDGSRTN